MSFDEQRDTLALIAHQALLVTAPMTVMELAGYDQQVYDTVLARAADAILSSAWLDRLKREAAADALEDAALTLPLWPEDRMILRDRAARIRTGATS